MKNEIIKETKMIRIPIDNFILGKRYAKKDFNKKIKKYIKNKDLKTNIN